MVPADKTCESQFSGRKRAIYNAQKAKDSGVNNTINTQGIACSDGRLAFGKISNIMPMHARHTPAKRDLSNNSTRIISASGYTIIGTILTITANNPDGRCGAAKYIVV